MTPKKAAPKDTTKREFLKQGTYVVPAILTFGAAPSFASAGSRSSTSARGPNGEKLKKSKTKVQELLDALLKAIPGNPRSTEP
jgi:hypothetical protein